MNRLSQRTHKLPQQRGEREEWEEGEEKQGSGEAGQVGGGWKDVMWL